MGVKLVGDSKPIKPFTVEELAERLEAQKAFYDGVSIYLEQRGSQPLETSMFAHATPTGRPSARSARPAGRNTGNYYGRPAPKPVAQSAGRFVNNQPLKNLNQDGKHYANMAQGNNNNAGRPFVATTQGPSNYRTGTGNNNGAPKPSGQRQVYNGIKDSEAIFALAARINAERAEREAAKLLEESMKSATVNSLDTPKIDASTTVNAAQNIVERNNIAGVKNLNERNGYNGSQDFDMAKEIAASVNAQLADEDNNPTVDKNIDVPKTPIKSKSLSATKTPTAPKNLSERKKPIAAKSINQRQGYMGPQDFDAVKKAVARIEAQSNASKNLREPMNHTVVQTLEAPKNLVESKCVNPDKSLNGSVHAPKNFTSAKGINAIKTVNVPQTGSAPQTINAPKAKSVDQRKGYNGPKDLDIVKEAADRIHAQSNASKNLAEPMSFGGANPKAQAFVPASRADSKPSLANPGLTNNDAAHARGFFSNGGLGSIRTDRSTTTREPPVKREPPSRVFLFKNVPDWMTLTDAIGLVHGGAIDCIFRSEMAEITVQFCEEAACKAYLEAFPNGIKVANPGSPTEEVTIDVEKAPRGQEIPPPLQVKIGSGGSRLVRVDGMLDAATIQALTVRAMEYEVDHVELRAEKNKNGSAYVFFCGLTDGWSFRQKLKQDEDWADYTAEFMVDPCKVATSFHGNTIPNRMASAVAAVAAE